MRALVYLQDLNSNKKAVLSFPLGKTEKDVDRKIKKEFEAPLSSLNLVIEEIEFNWDEFPLISKFLNNYFTSFDYYPLHKLNEIMNSIEKYTLSDLRKLESIIQYYGETSVNEFIEEFKKEGEDLRAIDLILNKFEFYEGITTPKEYGEYIFEQFYYDGSRTLNFLSLFIDYEALGEDIYQSEGGIFTDYGYLFFKEH